MVMSGDRVDLTRNDPIRTGTGLSPALVSIVFPFAFHISFIFHSLSFSPAIGFHSCFFFAADVSAPIRSTLHLLTFSVSFQTWDWLWYPMLWSQRWNRGVYRAEISIQISALARVKPQTLASSGSKRYH